MKQAIIKANEHMDVKIMSSTRQNAQWQASERTPEPISTAFSPISQAKRYTLLICALLLLLLFIVLSCTLLKSPFLAIAGITMLVLAWTLIRFPWLTLAAVFLSAGMPSLLIPLPGHTLRPVETSLFLCVCFVIAMRPYIRLTLPHVFALLFFIIALISFIHVPEVTTNASVFGANKRVYNLLIILLALFCGSFLVECIRDMSSFMVIALLSNIPLYLISLTQALSIKLPPLLMPDQNPAMTGDAGRLVGPFDGAATFGIYLTSLFAISLACSLLGTRQRDRRIGVIMLLATILALLGSGTRSALLASGVLLIVALLMTNHLKLVAGFFALVAGALLAFPSLIITHFTHAQTSTSNRLFLWHEALVLITQHPLLGIGLEQFHYYYNDLIISQSTQLNQHGISVHNQYLEWAMESGILWLLMGVLFLLSLIVVCFRYYPQANKQQRIPIFATGLAAIAVTVTGFLDVPLDNVEGGVFLCMLAGIALGCIVHIKRSQNALTSYSQKETS